MRIFARVSLTCLTATFALSACTAPPIKGEFEATVELKDASAECDADPMCWLPTQYGPSVVEGESLTLDNEWPARDTTVTVLCETEGELSTNNSGGSSTRWFGILVPTEQANQDVGQATEVSGGYLGYVNALWLKDVDAVAPDC